MVFFWGVHHVFIFFIASSHIIVVVVGGKNGRVHSLHRTFSLKSDGLGAAYTDSETANDNGGVFHEKNKRLLAFTTLLTFINTVSMVTPLWNCLLFCDRWIHGFFLEGTCFNQSESQTGSHDVSNKHDFSFQHLFFFLAITPTPSVRPSN